MKKKTRERQEASNERKEGDEKVINKNTKKKVKSA